MIDGYAHDSTFTSGDSVPLGTQIILVCRVVGLPYGTPLSYTWTCPNGPCEVKGYYGRKVYSEHILAVNTTSTRDGGTYTCQVTATGGQKATGSFSLNVPGMCVLEVTVVSVRLFRNVPGSKWWLLSNVLVRVGKTGEMVANWNNSRSWIFQGAKCDNVRKCNLEFV